ncbi:MAG: hypothetical protein WAP51_04565 [Candidatus Sungiibacteriota bacterium]
MNKSILLSNNRTILPAVLGALASVLFVAAVTWAATTINNNVNTGGTLTVSGESTMTGTTTLAGALYASSTVFSDGIFTNTRNAVLGAASGTPTVTGLNVTGDGYFDSGLGIGNATTSDGNLLVNNLAVFRGRVGISSTSPTVDFGLVGSGYLTGGLGVGIATTSGLSVSGMSTFNSAIDVRSGTSTFAGAAFGLMGSSTPYLEVGIAGDTAIGGALGTSTLSVESTTAGGCIELRGANGRWISMYVGDKASTSGNIQPFSVAGMALILQAGRCQTGNE